MDRTVGRNLGYMIVWVYPIDGAYLSFWGEEWKVGETRAAGAVRDGFVVHDNPYILAAVWNDKSFLVEPSPYKRLAILECEWGGQCRVERLGWGRSQVRATEVRPVRVVGEWGAGVGDRFVKIDLAHCEFGERGEWYVQEFRAKWGE